MQNEGRSQIIFSGALTEASQRFDRNSNPRASGRFSKKELRASGEHGITDSVTAIASITGQHRTIKESPENINGANAAFLGGARVRLWASDATILSFQTNIEANGEQRIRGRFRRLDAPVEADVRLLLGHGFSIAGLSSFVDFQTAYRWRGGGNAAEAHFDATLGVRPLPKFLLLLQSFNTIALQQQTRFNLPPSRQHKLQASIVYDLTSQVSLQLGAFASIAARESLREQGFVTALWWKF
ncbi:MAG: hypothetical protein ACKVON_01555 [Beijerinckiaceae bacterium]